MGDVERIWQQQRRRLIEQARVTTEEIGGRVFTVRHLPPQSEAVRGLDQRGSWMYRSKRFDGVRRELVNAAVEQRSWRNRNTPLRVGGHDPDDYAPPPPSSYELWRMGDSRMLPGGLIKSAHRGRVLRVY